MEKDYQGFIFNKISADVVAERKGKNPQTGEELAIPACIAPAFKPGKALKDLINN